MVVSALTFWKSFSKLKESEQIKLAHDVGTDLVNAENNLLEALKSNDREDSKYRSIQYLNVCEWFAFLINHRKITDLAIENHFKPSMKEEYKVLSEKFPEIVSGEKFKEFKQLFTKWQSETAKY